MALPRCLLLLLSFQAALTWSLVGAKKEQTIEEQLIASVLAQGGKLVRLPAASHRGLRPSSK